MAASWGRWRRRQRGLAVAVAEAAGNQIDPRLQLPGSSMMLRADVDEYANGEDLQRLSVSASGWHGVGTLGHDETDRRWRRLAGNSELARHGIGEACKVLEGRDWGPTWNGTAWSWLLIIVQGFWGRAFDCVGTERTLIAWAPGSFATEGSEAKRPGDDCGSLFLVADAEEMYHDVSPHFIYRFLLHITPCLPCWRRTEDLPAWIKAVVGRSLWCMPPSYCCEERG